MAVTAEELTRKFTDSASDGTLMALENVGELLRRKMTPEEFNGITNHIIASETNDISAARRDFNRKYLEALGNLMEI